MKISIDQARYGERLVAALATLNKWNGLVGGYRVRHNALASRRRSTCRRTVSHAFHNTGPSNRGRYMPNRLGVIAVIAEGSLRVISDGTGLSRGTLVFGPAVAILPGTLVAGRLPAVSDERCPHGPARSDRGAHRDPAGDPVLHQVVRGQRDHPGRPGAGARRQLPAGDRRRDERDGPVRAHHPRGVRRSGGVAADLRAGRG